MHVETNELNPNHIETSELICTAYQLTGFCMMKILTSNWFIKVLQ